MRFDILALALLGAGSFALAAAADPAPATQTDRAAAAPAATDSASASTSAARAPAPAPASTPAASPTAAPEVSAAEQHLISIGYKPQMRDGQKIYCRREAALGSRIVAAQHCGTVAQLSTTTQEGKDYLDKAQRSQLNPMAH